MLDQAIPGTDTTGPAEPASENLTPVLVRTYSAGVHFGYLRRREGREVTLLNARRIWRWAGAWTLNEIATAGLDIKKSKVSAPVPTIILLEAIEIIAVTPAGVTAIEAAKWAA